MTQDEFQKKYHEFSAPSAGRAIEAAIAVNNVGIEGDKAVAVKLPPPAGWCLMLKTAAEYLHVEYADTWASLGCVQ